ncbi:SsrA-binding protein, partial [Peziza echinospora]
IALNRRATHDYFIEQRFEAGLCLQGWEVKSIRAGRAQLNDSYVILKQQEAWLIGSHMTPLSAASTHVRVEPNRSRKLLLTARELVILNAAVQRQGYTLIALKLYWKKNFVKLSFGLAKGKKLHDKRMTVKEQDWAREKQRLTRLSR